MPMWNNMYLQNSSTPLMEHLLMFHDHSMIIIMMIVLATCAMMSKTSKQTQNNQFMVESQQAELFWTSAPAIMLIFIAIPSLKTLYMMEDNMNPHLTIKTMGFQWYWQYDYSNMLYKKSFEANNTINMNLRNKTTNKNIVIPINTPTRMLISSKDVLHSWTIPSVGVKSDATPGRINQLTMNMKRPTVMMGQCSEICGSGHSFMPILMECVSMKKFIKNM